MDPKDQARTGYAQRKQQPAGQVDWFKAARTAYGRVEKLGAMLADSEAKRDELVARQTASLKVSEPRVYGPHSEFSWFVDLFKNKRGGDVDARARLAQHAREAEADAARRAELRQRAAQVAYEARFASTPGEQRALAQWSAAGRVIFERRALTRVDGGGGYLVPPAWLIEEYVPAARADAALGAAVTRLPLPDYTDSINIPRLKTGIGAGAQTADASPAPGADLADSFANSPVITVSGTQDVAMQWLDQSAGGAGGALDEMIWRDLHQAEQLQISGQLILGSGTNGQMTGLLPPVTAIGTSLAVYAPSGNTESDQTYSYGSGGTALLTTIAQCVSGVTRARGRRPTHILTNPWVWDLVSSMTDQQTRPLIDGHGPHPVPPGAEPEPGVVGCLPGIGLPLLGDLNVGDSFGGGVSPPAQPYLAPVNAGVVAYQAGTGASAVYTPMLPIVADDLVLFTGEPKMQLYSQVLAGSMQYRFQLRTYVAGLVNRYVAAGTGTLANSGGWAAGACTSYGVVTQFGSNSLLDRTAQGF
jgi:HK97 family phage major capsid protein